MQWGMSAERNPKLRESADLICRSAQRETKSSLGLSGAPLGCVSLLFRISSCIYNPKKEHG